MKAPDNAKAPGRKIFTLPLPCPRGEGDGSEDDGGGAQGGDGGGSSDEQNNQQQGSQEGGDGGGDAAIEIPEKFRVMSESGELDHQATMQKVLGSYTHMEKRLGSGDVPPKSAEEYKLEAFLPEGFEADQEKMKGHLGYFHGLGLTNSQVQGVMNRFGFVLGEGVASEKAGFEAAQAELKENWGADFEKNKSLSNLVVATFADKEDIAALQDPKVANNPPLQRLLAKIGLDLTTEDRPAGGEDSGSGGDSIEALQKSKAYWDPKHPEHTATKAKVTAYYEKKFGKK